MRSMTFTVSGLSWQPLCLSPKGILKQKYFFDIGNCLNVNEFTKIVFIVLFR